MASQEIEFDQFSDPNNPRKIKFEDIVAAARRISGYVDRTPCLRAHMSSRLGMEVFLKAESMQHTGCFKERGVLNALTQLNVDQKRIGVISASIGNYGIALSCVATKMSIPCIVVMPINTPTNKISKAREYGAKVMLHGTNMQDAIMQAKLLRKDKKMLYING
ncbi:L-threo-3-hydroxyaspartate ammonia-lyase-like, partial [Hyposmocoma kahamanoa]|uniref:L-threo-3-hydroxyaspartate ammonia-lyase-like n=1 Tax=Hyposmocoma kahamanoa TaxID=1477025 RepID=UPI000E6D9232